MITQEICGRAEEALRLPKSQSGVLSSYQTASEVPVRPQKKPDDCDATVIYFSFSLRLVM